MIKNDVAFSPISRADVPVDKGFRFGPYVAQNGDDEAIGNLMKSVSVVDNFTEANLKIVREGEEMFFEATKNIDAFEKFSLWSKIEDEQSEILPIPADADSSLLPKIPKTKGRVYDCDICHKLYKNKFCFISHKATHTNETPFKCTFCEQSYTWKRSLKNHVAIIHVQRYKCRICDRAFINKKKLSQHELTHSGKMPFQCEECGAGYKSQNGLQSHSEKIHSLFNCRLCGKVWKSNESLQQHKKSHKIDWQSSLQQISAMQENNFECDICHCRLQSEGVLQVHKECHTDDKPFECSFCGQAYRKRDHLATHAARIHNQRYKCHLCEEDYPYQKELTAHMTTHLGEKPLQCDECEATYKSRAGLQYHQRVAHRRFECFCGEVCDSKESLEQHSNCHYMSVDSSSGG